MAIITKITTQQKNQDRFNIFWDNGNGEEFAFSVDSEVLIKFQLKKGMELDDLSIIEVQYLDDIRKAYNNAIHYLAKRMRSEKEIKDYLKKKEMEEPVINEVIHKLTTQKYINDEEYATAYVRTQLNTTDKGPEVIRIELKERGIPREIMDRSIEEYSYEAQLEKAVKLAEKFFSKKSKDSLKVQKQKFESMLGRKGYSFEIISTAMNATDIKNDSDEEMASIRYQGEKLQRKYQKFTGFEFERKMKQALYQKGFSMDVIENYLSEIEKS